MSISVHLTADETAALLQAVPSAYHTEIMDALLTALGRSLSDWIGSKVVLINLEGHGREDISEEVDVSRTIGWFTTIYPVWLDLRGVEGPGKSLVAVKEQLRKIPQHGLGFGLLKYLTTIPGVRDAFRKLPQAQISFNYLGQVDRMLGQERSYRMALEDKGLERSVSAKRNYVIDINGGIANGQLGFEWSFSSTLHRRETIEKAAEKFMAALRELIIHCQSPDAGEYTPSDLADFGWNQQKIDEIMDEFSKFEDEMFG